MSHSKVTINSGGNLTGGGDVSLGDTITLALKDNISLPTATFSATLGVGGEASISSKLIFNYLGNLGTLTWEPSDEPLVATGTDPDKSFVVEMARPQPKDVVFSWWVVN